MREANVNSTLENSTKNFTSSGKRKTVLSLKTAAPIALCLGTVVMSLFAIVEGSLSMLMVYLIFGLGGLVFVWRSGDTSIRIYLTVYGLTAVLSVAFYFYLYATLGAPYYQGGSDDLSYEMAGKVFADTYEFHEIFNYGSIEGDVVQYNHNSVGYVYLVGLLVKLGDALDEFHTMIPRMFNSLLLALMAVLVFKYVQAIHLDKPLAVACAFFSVLMPGMIYIAGFTFRDITITFITFLVFYTWSSKTKFARLLISKIAITTFSVIVLSELRTQTAFAVACAALSSYVVYSRNRWTFFAKFSLATILVSLVFYQYHEFISDIISFEILERYSNAYIDIRGGHGSLTSRVFETPFPAGIPIRLAYGLFAPLPGFSLTLLHLLFLLGCFVSLYFILFLFIGAFQSLKSMKYLPLLIFASIGFLPFALITGAPRNIPSYWPFFVILVGIGYCKYPKYKTMNKKAFILIVCLFPIALIGLFLIR